MFDLESLEALRRQHPAWRLLASESVALVASFLQNAFVVPNRRVIAQADLAEALEDMLFSIREQRGDTAYPEKALDYLNDWAANDKAWRPDRPAWAGPEIRRNASRPAGRMARSAVARRGDRHLGARDRQFCPALRLTGQAGTGAVQVARPARLAMAERRRRPHTPFHRSPSPGSTLPSGLRDLPHLTVDERAVFDDLRWRRLGESALRLEQERVDFACVVKAAAEVVAPGTTSEAIPPSFHVPPDR